MSRRAISKAAARLVLAWLDEAEKEGNDHSRKSHPTKAEWEHAHEASWYAVAVVRGKLGFYANPDGGARQ